MTDTIDIAGLKRLVRGRLRANVRLGKYSWFRTGGPADLFFEPVDEADLAVFLKNLPSEFPLYVIGVGSNLLVRDGGVEGAVIYLKKGFDTIAVDGDRVTAGAGAMDVYVARRAMEAGLSGLEFMVGVPGTVGGALFMNAGAYGHEVADIFCEARGVTTSGEIVELGPEEFQFSYRKTHVQGYGRGELIFTSVTFKGMPDSQVDIKARMAKISRDREESQPLKTRTGGSTFKNPDSDTSPYKAWQLIDMAGCRGLEIGGAKVSEKHCNFLINTGSATAADIEELGETVRRQVFEKCGVMLEWEIQRIGQSQKVERVEL